jgi:hypothetical protein
MQWNEFTLEYVTYETEYDAPIPETTGTYSCWCIGYVNEGEAWSSDSNVLALNIQGIRPDWPDVTPGSEDVYINQLHFTNDGKLRGSLTNGAEVTSDNEAPGGGSSDLIIRYTTGNFYGTPEASKIDNLSITINNKAGKVALLCVLHRDTISLSDWELLDTRSNPYDASIDPDRQYISVYKKLINANSESYTIIQNSTARLAATTYFFEDDVNITYKDAILLDPDSTTYKYAVEKYSKYDLCIVSDNWAGNSPLTITPSTIILPTGTGSIVRRLITFVNSNNGETILTQESIETSLASRALNRMFIYQITLA